MNWPLVTVALMNSATLITSAVLLSYEFGRKVGVGVTLLGYFMKPVEHL